MTTDSEKTKEGVWGKIARAVAGKSKIDDDVLDNLEEAFITSDVGVDTTLKIIDRIQERVARDKYVGSDELNSLLCEEISEMLAKSGEEELDDFEIKKTKRAIRNNGGRRERRRENHHNRQTCSTI